MAFMAVGVSFILLFPPFAAASVAESCEEPLSLLQTVNNVNRGGMKIPTKHCDCLNWKETYAAGLADCGQGFEFTRALGYPSAVYPQPEEWLHKVENVSYRNELKFNFHWEYCQSFYLKFDDRWCARVAMDRSDTDWYGRSWCYVSNQCSSAMSISGAKVSAKFCETGVDSLLSNISPEALLRFGKSHGFGVPGYFLKVAYPVVRDFYWTNYTDHLPEVDAIQRSGKPTVIDEVDEHSRNKMIIFGHKVYVMPSSFDSLECIANCTQAGGKGALSIM